MRIYVAGPYSQNLTNSQGARLENTLNAIDAGLALLGKGHIPFIPHLTHWVDQRAVERGITLGWDDYMEWDRAWLEMCHGLLYLGSSRGADLELKWAKEKDMEIFYSVEDVPDVS